MITSNSRLSQDYSPVQAAPANRVFSASRIGLPNRSLRDSESSRALAGMLLAASMAALLVVADQVISTWTDGHLLAGWVALWAVAFAGLALLTPPLRKVAAFVAGGFVTYLAEQRKQREEDRMWEAASRDPRVREEIRAAMQSSEKMA